MPNAFCTIFKFSNGSVFSFLCYAGTTQNSNSKLNHHKCFPTDCNFRIGGRRPANSHNTPRQGTNKRCRIGGRTT